MTVSAKLVIAPQYVAKKVLIAVCGVECCSAAVDMRSARI